MLRNKIRASNINILIFGHLNMNSLRNKINLFYEQIKGSIGILMVSETKLNNRFPKGQFLIDGFHALFENDYNKNGGSILSYARLGGGGGERQRGWTYKLSS